MGLFALGRRKKNVRAAQMWWRTSRLLQRSQVYSVVIHILIVVGREFALVSVEMLRWKQ
jgi:hypothetical protein